MKYTIYAIAHPITEAPRYVGLTRKTIQQRMVNHWNMRGKSDLPLYRWMQELDGQGLRPLIYELEKTDDTYLAEAKWIEYFRRQGFWVYNQHSVNYGRYVPHPSGVLYGAEKEARLQALYPDADKTMGKPHSSKRREYEMGQCLLYRES